PRFNDTPSFNQTVQNALGFNTNNHPAEDYVLSPRVGFNWNPGGSKQQLRGGIGIFAGKAPYVWISNAYAGTGVEQVALACSPLDRRRTYSRVSTQVVDATILTNTSKGDESVLTLQLVRPFSHGLTLSGNYAHQNARSAFDATSSRAISNWRFQHSKGNIFKP